MKTITLSSKNQMVVPKEVRQVMHLKGGDSLMVEKVTKNHVILKKAPSYRDLIGSVKRVDTDPVQRIRTAREQWRGSDVR